MTHPRPQNVAMPPGNATPTRPLTSAAALSDARSTCSTPS
jgi:hypothetical protein